MSARSQSPFTQDKRRKAMIVIRNQDELSKLPPSHVEWRWGDVKASQSALMKAKESGLIESRGREKGRRWSVTEPAEQYLRERCGVELDASVLTPCVSGASAGERAGDGEEEWVPGEEDGQTTLFA